MIATAEKQKTRLLMIDDNPKDRQFMQTIISESDGGTGIELEEAEKLSKGLQRIEQGGIDLILLDLFLPDSPWYSTFPKVYSSAEGVPIVVLSDIDNKSHALELMQNGAQDYLVKGEVDCNRMVRCIEYAIERYKMQKNARALYESAEGLLYDTEKLVQLSQQLNTMVQQDEVFSICKEMLPQIFSAELFSIFLLDLKTNLLQLAVHNHPHWAVHPEPIGIPENNGIMWDAVRKLDLIYTRNMPDSKYAGSQNQKKYSDDHAICVPLMVKNNVLGVLNLNNFLQDRLVTKAHLHNIKRIVDHIALTIFNNILIQRIEKHSIQDL